MKIKRSIIMNETHYSKLESLTSFGEMIKTFRKSKKIKLSQTKLSNYVNQYLSEKNILSQGDISKIERGKYESLNQDQVKAICKVCEFPIDIQDAVVEIIQNSNITHTVNSFINVKSTGYIVTRPSNDDIRPYLGKYYCYFYSTNSRTPKIINGTIELKIDDSNTQNCLAVLILYDDDKTPIKTYVGQFFINTRYKTTYCVLIGGARQEVCFLLSNHFNASISDNLINIAIALTTSAGAQKRPTMHRMIISRTEPTDSALKILSSQLRLNSDVLWISEESISSIESDLENNKSYELKYKNYITECIKHIKQYGKPQVYYHIDESDLYDSSIVIKDEDEDLRGLIVSYLRSYTDIPYYNKISDTVRDICLEIISKNKII